MKNTEKILARKPEEKRPLGRLGVDGDNINMNLKEIWCEGVDLTHLTLGMVQ
jgi:hypothetical protein